MSVRSPRSSCKASLNWKYSPPSSETCTSPSTCKVSRVTKMPKLATPVTVPLKSSPTRSLTNQHFSQASTSREASSARRSLPDRISPSFSHTACSCSRCERPMTMGWSSSSGM
ncbi:Uncharacterised protein [Bordetella pertussis]|nr:Uncharacterised protein [Bordetella pertussis]